MPTLDFQSRVEATAREVFDWHARPGAFERLVPPWMDVRLEQMAFLRRSGFAETFATERIYASKAEAVSHIFENLERDICERCTARIFRECKRVPRRTEGVVPIET